MVRKLKVLLFTTLLCAVSGCTVAVPEVSTLSQVFSFASKSESPFSQENLGDALFFSGYCLPGVTGFEYRFNSFAQWTEVSTTAPAPGLGEYLVGNHPYDLDCSDGDFDFYLFHSSILDNFTLNGEVPGTDDPESLELRAIGNLTLPTILYTRPAPSSFQIIFDDYNFHGYSEVGRSQRFRVSLVDATGRHANALSGTPIPLTLTLTDETAALLPAGEIYESTCTSLATTAEKTFAPGEDEISLCYVASGVTADHTINIQASHSGMISTSSYVFISPVNSVKSWLTATGSGRTPEVMLKGVDYHLTMGIGPLYTNSNTRYITNYQGSLQIASPQTSVTFNRESSDIDCPSTPQNGSMTCTSNATQKNFLVNIAPGYSNGFVSLTAAGLPQAACGSGCTIYDEGNNYQIDNNNYFSTTYNIPVVDGPITYSQPYMSLSNSYGPSIRLGDCISADIALANIDEIPLSVTADRTLQVSSQGNLVEFFYSPNCTTSAGTTFNLLFFTGELFKSVYFMVPENDPGLPADGILNIQITDMTTTLVHTKQFYIKNNN